jgi:putative exosortase-associated protein (TIGR04073 family)
LSKYIFSKIIRDSEVYVKNSIAVRVFLFLALLLPGYAIGSTEQGGIYGDAIRLKLGSGISNMLFAIAEVPKNIINTSNQANVLLGVSGGTLKGVLHSVGRMLSGVTDVLTFPVATKPITTPAFVWQDFTTDTSYGPFFSAVRTAPPDTKRVR